MNNRKIVYLEKYLEYLIANYGFKTYPYEKGSEITKLISVPGFPIYFYTQSFSMTRVMKC